MKILELYLSGYKRLDLLGASELKYNPEAHLQLFLGKNGIGKSSLLNELSPLPCEASELREGGVKQIKILHRNKNYRIIYTLRKKLECNFFCDGVELNTGGTVKVQRDLIKEHFNYDTQIHDVLTGFTLLSNMGPLQRREWFVKMSKSDMTYAIGVYNRIRTAERDIRGAIKMNHQRLVNEQTKLPKQEEVVQAKFISKTLKDELNQLLPFVEHGLNDNTVELQQLEERIKAISDRIIKSDKNIRWGNLTSLEDILAEQQNLANLYNALNDKHRTLMVEHTELHDIHQKHQLLTNKPLNVIDDEIKSVREAIDQHNLMIKLDVGDNPKQQMDDFFLMKDELRLVVQLLAHNPINEETGQRTFTREKYRQLQSDIHDRTQERLACINKIKYNEQLLKSYQDTHDVLCPNCNHTFKPGVTCTDISALEKLVISLKQEEEQLSKQLNELQHQYTSFGDYLGQLSRISKLHDTYPSCQRLINYIRKDTNFYDNPRSALAIINDYEIALTAKANVLDLTIKLNTLEEERIRRIAAEGNDIQYIIDKMMRIENETTLLSQQIAQTKRNLDDIATIVHKQQLLLDGKEVLTNSVNTYKAKTLEQVRYENNNLLKQIIGEKQTQLAINEALVNQLSQSEMIIQQLERDNRAYKDEQEALQLLTNLLSPQDGLIAESLIGFLNQFLDEMYNVLEQIWSYGMRPYMEIEGDGIELDYRFKVDVDGLEEPVKDVSRLSRGQKEIMDFVFKLLLMQHLDMADYPLFMDEVGSSFDGYHRDRLYRYIKLLVESGQVQQVFIISHIASSHEALNTADVCVLDMDATMVDSNVNKVLRLK